MSCSNDELLDMLERVNYNGMYKKPTKCICTAFEGKLQIQDKLAERFLPAFQFAFDYYMNAKTPRTPLKIENKEIKGTNYTATFFPRATMVTSETNLYNICRMQGVFVE